MKAYLGDGVYVEWDPGREAFILTTENGVEITNTIVLELEVYRNLILFVEQLKS